MKFNLDKKGYNIAEVDNYLKNMAIEYNRVLEAQRARIDMLKEELTTAESKLLEYKEKTATITRAIYNAVDKAHEIETLAKKKYDMEIERLKVFHDKWVSYYYRILEAYPLDNDLAAAGAFSQKVRRIFANTNLDTIDGGQSVDLINNIVNHRLSAKGEKRLWLIFGKGVHASGVARH